MQSLNYVITYSNTLAGQFNIADSGLLVYAAGGIVPDWQTSIVWVDHEGTAQPVANLAGSIDCPSLSPDGRKITYNTMGREWQAWVYDLNRSTATRITMEGKVCWPHWSPDGDRVVFNLWGSEHPNLFWQAADGSATMERLTTSENTQYPGSFSRERSVLAFVEDHPGTGWDILLLDLRSRRITPFLNSRSNESYPEFSPDEHWLAYTSDESGHDEVYVRAFPGPGGKWQVSGGGGSESIWARDGKRLFYRWRNQVWGVDVRMNAGFTIGKPQLLFEKAGYLPGIPIRNWDISSDGNRFLMVRYKEIKLPPVTEMILVQNWFEELKRLVPAGEK